MQVTTTDAWADVEFGAADLGDARRSARLVHLAQTFAQQPSASLPQASDDPAMLKAAYRFFDNAAVDPAAMLASHLQATTARLRAVPLVLAVQDTSLLDWTDHPATTGLGPLASATHQGLLAHTTLALTPERVPLGLLAQQVWARDAESYAHQRDRRQRTLTEKESSKWVTSLQAVNLVRTICPTTEFVSVGDREADVYDLFVEPRVLGVELLVRAAWDRRVAHPEKYLWASALAAAPVGSLTFQLPRQANRPARTATLTVRARAITLRPPKSRAAGLPSVTVWAVWAG